jgi:hypothetical protein
METSDNSLVKPKSTFSPRDGRNDLLDDVVSLLKRIPQPVKKINYNYNISKKEREAIDALRQNRDIIIKEADKGSAVVIMDVDYYTKRVNDIITNATAYQVLPSNNDKQIMNKMKSFINNYKKELTENEIKYLTKFEYKTSNFYGLPKIHKSSIITTAIQNQKSEIIITQRPADLKLRPIVAGPMCPTHRLSHFIDIIVQPLISGVEAWVRDDFHILNKLPQYMEESVQLATFDVESLYSNINHDLGLTALQFWLKKIPRETTRISNKCILDGMLMVLENTFQFNSCFYRQLVGTAMGTKAAPTYATLTLGYLECTLYEKIRNNYPEDVYKYFKSHYFRFLDDVLILYNETKLPLNNINTLLNTLNCQLRFKLEMSGDEVNFLDINIYKSADSKLHTDIFYKVTDTKQYLDFGSNHPRHIKVALPYNLSRRICTIVSDENIKKIRLSEMHDSLRKCGYPSELIKDGIKKASSYNRQELLDGHRTDRSKKSNTTNKCITYVSTCNHNYSNHSNLVKETFNALQADASTKEIYRHKDLLPSSRQPANLKQILTKAKFDKGETRGVFKCNSPRCKLCSIILTGDSFLFQNVNYNFKVNAVMNCEVCNCIYVISCGGCSKIYIGETSNLRLRTNLHRDHANKDCGLGVSRHIHSCTQGANDNNKFTIMPFYKLNNDNLSYRRNMEQHFIDKFRPELNSLLH